MPSSEELFNSKMNALANSINTKAGTSGAKTIDQMKTAVDSIVRPTGNINITSTAQTDVTNYATATVVDSDLVQGNIKKDVNILGVVGTYEGSGIVPTGNINITSMNQTDVTNYATAQVVEANLVAENIKKDVSILGVTGIYEGGGGFDSKLLFTSFSLPEGSDSKLLFISFSLSEVAE